MESILQVNHLKKVFHQRGKGDIPAVNDVSFCLYPGEILGIVGESGSGKSTVAKLITRLVDPTEGEIILDGQDIMHLKGTALKDAYGKLQMVSRIRLVPLIPEEHWEMELEKVSTTKECQRWREERKQQNCWNNAGWMLLMQIAIPIRSVEDSASGLPLPEHWQWIQRC